MLNKIAYFLFFLMVLLAACGDSGSSSFEELEQGADVDSSADGTDLSSGALSSGGKMSSSSSSAWSKKDTLFYIDKICYNRVDGQHSLQVRFKTDIAQTNDVYVYSFYNFSGMKEGRSCGFSVTTSYVYLTDSVSEKGWFNVNLELKDMNLYSDRESETPGVADFHVIFLNTRHHRSRVGIVHAIVHALLRLQRDGQQQCDGCENCSFHIRLCHNYLPNQYNVS